MPRGRASRLIVYLQIRVRTPSTFHAYTSGFAAVSLTEISHTGNAFRKGFRKVSQGFAATAAKLHKSSAMFRNSYTL